MTITKTTAKPKNNSGVELEAVHYLTQYEIDNSTIKEELFETKNGKLTDILKPNVVIISEKVQELLLKLETLELAYYFANDLTEKESLVIENRIARILKTLNYSVEKC